MHLSPSDDAPGLGEQMIYARTGGRQAGKEERTRCQDEWRAELRVSKRESEVALGA